jgi:hypothetical protein
MLKSIQGSRGFYYLARTVCSTSVSTGNPSPSDPDFEERSQRWLDEFQKKTPRLSSPDPIVTPILVLPAKGGKDQAPREHVSAMERKGHSAWVEATAHPKQAHSSRKKAPKAKASFDVVSQMGYIKS